MKPATNLQELVHQINIEEKMNKNNNPSATLAGFESALVGKTSQGNLIYDLELIVQKMLIDSGHEDCLEIDINMDGDDDPYMDAVDQFFYEMSYYQTKKGDIPFVIIDGTDICYPFRDKD